MYVRARERGHTVPLTAPMEQKPTSKLNALFLDYTTFAVDLRGVSGK